MLTLSALIEQIEKIEGAINVTHVPRLNDKDLMDRLWEQRGALNMAASYLLPREPEEAIFLHGLLEEYVEFIGDEPTDEGEQEAAIEAILRLNGTLRDYNIGA